MMSVDSAFVLFVIGALVLSASTAFLNLNLPGRRRRRGLRSRADDPGDDTTARRRVVTGPPPALPASPPPAGIAPPRPSGGRVSTDDTRSGPTRRHSRGADRTRRPGSKRRSAAEEQIEHLVDTDPDRVAATITQLLRADDPPVRAPRSTTDPNAPEGPNP